MSRRARQLLNAGLSVSLAAAFNAALVGGLVALNRARAGSPAPEPVRSRYVHLEDVEEPPEEEPVREVEPPTPPDQPDLVELAEDLPPPDPMEPPQPDAPEPLALDVAAPSLSPIRVAKTGRVAPARARDLSRRPRRSARQVQSQRFQDPFQAESVDQPPKPKSGNAQPVYPRLARRRRLSGSVSLRLLIDAAGAVQKVTVTGVAGHSSFRDAVLRVVKSWRFEPARHQGRRVAVWATKTIGFRWSRR